MSKILKVIDGRATQKQQQQQQQQQNRTRWTEAIAKCWEINAFVERLI